jgi:thymidylate synthase (FAD)
MKATYIDHMGTDLSVVNAAKVSFGKRSEWEVLEWDFWDNEEDETSYYREEVLSKQDQGLIQFLARGCTSGDWDASVYEVYETGWGDGKKGVHDYNSSAEIEDLLNHIRKMPSHWSPFAHTAISLHLKMPIFVARQIMKHTTGIEYNEVSRRYVDSEPEFYVPDVWRKKADNVKQGSSDEAVEMLCLGPNGNQERALPTLSHSCGKVRQSVGVAYAGCLGLYKEMLESGVAPEQARMVLPQSMYTEVIATGNLFAWANLYIQRSDGHTQKETQDLAKQIGEIIQPLYPVSWAALVD